MGSLFNSQEREDMLNDIEITGLSQRLVFDIRRQQTSLDTVLGGVTIAMTAIQSWPMDLQPIRGEDVVSIAGRHIDAQFLGFVFKDASIRERDIITSDSGTTRYEVMFVRNLFQDHNEFLARKVE